MKALLFDLDDTLLDYSGPAAACWESACAAVAAPRGVDPRALTAAIAESSREFWSDPGRSRRERLDMTGAWRKVVAGALARLGTTPDGLAPAIAEDFAARRRAAMRLFPDAEETLVALRARGLGLALVTNGDAREQRDKIERHDLARYFDTIVIEGEFGVGKPEPAVFLHALAALDAAPAQAWMIGDNLEFDVAGAQRLGIIAAWLDRRGSGLAPGAPIRPDRVIHALSELLAG